MKALNKEQLIKDLDYFYKKIVKMHPNPFKKLTKKELVEYLDNLKANNDGMDIQELGMELMKLIAMIGDSHTELGVSFEVLGTLSYPFKFKYITDGYYVMSASKELKGYLGAKLIGVNDLSISDVEQCLKAVIPVENDISLHCYLPSKLVEPKILINQGITKDNKASFKFIIEGKESIKEVSALDYSVELIDINDQIKEPDLTLGNKEMYWVKDMPKLDAVYLQYNECEIIDDYKMTKVVKEIKAFDRKKLIIDIRNNKGGDSDVLNPVLRYVKTNPEIKVFVLTGADTYSSAIYNLVQLSRFKNVTTLGDIPNGNPTHYGQVESFKLPNSKLEVYTSTRTFTFKGYKLGESFIPQHIVSSNPLELLKGVDTQFKYLENNLI